mmetsp:Transcript_25101/g.76199  ORF Transcript_25101/g.76199 Transcript_25101/m.76199 type:complete len:313 (+) Transcript_25101:291-1229(+)|eukprot:scaffold88741_cov38-Tisochrysis_lutea.AAC.1
MRSHAHVTSARAPQTRSSIFTLLLAILLTFETGFCLHLFIWNVANLASDSYVSYEACLLQSFLVVVAMYTISWVNTIVMVELYRMLRATKAIQIYMPPSRWVVLRRCLAAWLMSVATAGLVLVPGVPVKPRLIRGLFCAPISDGTPYGVSKVNMIVLPLFLGIPTCITLSIALISWRRRLLDFELERQDIVLTRTSNALHDQAAHRARVKAARSLTVYFSHVFACQFMWFPALLTIIIGARPVAVIGMGIATVPLQSIVSSSIAMTKTDVREAAVNLFRPFCSCFSRRRVAPLGAGVFALQPRKRPIAFTSG